MHVVSNKATAIIPKTHSFSVCKPITMPTTEDGKVLPLTLWGAPTSSSTNRIRVALALKKIPFVLKDPGSPAVMASEEYRKQQHPLNQMPILEVNGVKLRQSVAILEYLEETFTEVKLLPEDPVKRARIREVVEIINSFVQPTQNSGILKVIAEHDKELAVFLPAVFPNPDTGELAPYSGGDANLFPQRFIHKGFRAIESLLAQNSEKFCFGDEPTLAECFLVPQILGAKRVKIADVKSTYPNLYRIYENVIGIEEVKATLSDILTLFG